MLDPVDAHDDGGVLKGLSIPAVGGITGRDLSAG